MEKHAKSEIEFTWGKIGWSKRGIVSKTQTNAQTDVLRSANEQTLINYIQTMAASAPEQSTHFKSTGLPRLLGNIIILIVNLVWFLFFPPREITGLVQYQCVCSLFGISEGTDFKNHSAQMQTCKVYLVPVSLLFDHPK